MEPGAYNTYLEHSTTDHVRQQTTLHATDYSENKNVFRKVYFKMYKI